MSWADAPLDTAKDLGVVAATNIGGPGADAALNEVTEHLFGEHGSAAR